MGGAFCITYAVRRSQTESAAGAPPARFGYIVAKNVGNAVTRNLVRRRMKAVSEGLIHHGMNGVEIVFRALPAAAEATFDELERELRGAATRLAERLGAGGETAGVDR